MESDREFVWAKVPGGYRVAVKDRIDSEALVDFGGTQTVVSGEFTIIMPNAPVVRCTAIAWPALK